MGLFRRREPLHERLAREGGLTGSPSDAPPQRLETGIHGLPRAREWDATVTADAPALDGDAARFVVLPDGTVLVEEGPEGSFEPLAAAAEQVLRPPYRARAVRQSKTMWAVQGRRIEIVRIPEDVNGDEIELAHTRDGTTLSLDDTRQFGTIRALEARGEQEGPEYVVRAERLDGDLWEVQVGRL